MNDKNYVEMNPINEYIAIFI